VKALIHWVSSLDAVPHNYEKHCIDISQLNSMAMLPAQRYRYCCDILVEVMNPEIQAQIEAHDRLGGNPLHSPTES